MTAPQPPGGVPYVDPTENVVALVKSAMQRQDDMRDLVASHAAEVTRLAREHAAEMARLRDVKDSELRQAETARIDAIRAVDVGAVNRAAEVAATQASALANQLIATAEASRVQVAAAASAAVTSLSAALEPIQKDIRDLRDAQSRGQGGKEQVTETREVRGETRLNLGAVVGIAVLAVAVLGLLLAYAAKK